MFYVILQQQLCGKLDVWHNFHYENYFQEKNYNFVTLTQLTKYSRNTTKQSTKSIQLITDKFLMKLSTHPESTVARKIDKILPCRNEILHAVLG